MISFIIPLYNKERTIINCVNSILNNISVKDYEVIVIDDDSYDNSFSLVKNEFSIYDNVFIYKNKVNKGRSYTRNKGLALSSFSYVFFLDADDVITKNVDFIFDYIKDESYKDCILSFGYSCNKNDIVNKLLQAIRINSIYYNVLFFYALGFYLPSCSSVLIPKLLLKNIAFEHSLSEGEDIVFWLTLNSFCKFIHIPSNIVYYNHVEAIVRRTNSFEYLDFIKYDFCLNLYKKSLLWKKNYHLKNFVKKEYLSPEKLYRLCIIVFLFHKQYI